MPAFYRSTIREFFDHVNIVGTLASAKAHHGFFNVESAQIEAWEKQVDILKRSFSKLSASFPSALEWGVLLEFPIPRRQRRIDAVVLAHDVIIVVEFKTGITEAGLAAVRQAEDYALDLSDFHLPSHNRKIVPVVVAPGRTHSQIQLREQFVQHATRTTSDQLDQILLSAYQTCTKSDLDILNLVHWDNGMYRPVPTIIEAAAALYSRMSVREITHSHSGAENLTQTSEFILAAVQRAQINGEKLVCFVTGIPGAGKTLVGLNVVHNPEIRSEGRSASVFMSGNGPLVEILREALTDDAAKSRGQNKKEARRQVRTFIQNIHHFVQDNLDREESDVPSEHAIVFDEAQRAWNAEQNQKKYRTRNPRWHVSEPEMVLRIMDRHKDWAVIIALVGGGQEIHKGEAGLAEWGQTIKTKFPDWHVLASPEAMEGGDSVAGSVLFSGRPEGVQITQIPALHLKVNIRSYRAERLAEWVNRVLSGDAATAAEISKSFSQHPVLLTRDLVTAKQWLRKNTLGSRRYGLIASSGAVRLRAFGIETSHAIREAYSYPYWFLKDENDVRSSYQLEVVATEFEIQGLELDDVGLCWGGDFIWEPVLSRWIASDFKGTKWVPVRSQERYERVRNKYRVLLTRSREVLLIWVPMGDTSDPTRDPVLMDNTFDYLVECGAKLLG